MINSINLLFLSIFFFETCSCDNSDIENGSKLVKYSSTNRSAQDAKKKKPQFKWALAEEVKKESLYTTRPMPLVLNVENFSKYDITAYRLLTQRVKKGTIYSMNA